MVINDNEISDQNSPSYNMPSNKKNSGIKPVFLIMQHDPFRPPQGSADRFDQWLQHDIPCWDSIFQLQASPA